MKLLISNDDGIYSPGLWELVKALSSIAEITVVAPATEQSARGTAVSLRKPLKVTRVESKIEGIKAFAVSGTPSDSVIVALGKIIPNKIDLVISGINHGPNLGDDVLISGTVGAALQGYLRGFPAIALSLAMDWEKTENLYLASAARVAALVAAKVCSTALVHNCLLNINVPDLPVNEIKGIKKTHLVHQTHVETVEERANGESDCYWLERHNIYRGTVKKADITAISDGYVSLTALHNVFSHRQSMSIGESFCNELFQELQDGLPA